MGKSFTILGAILLLVMLAVLPKTAVAADAMYRFVHNDHDALVIGEVTEVKGSEITIDVKDQIISSRHINVGSPKNQISIEGTIKVTNINQYHLFYDTDIFPQAGDYVLVSINKNGRSYTNAWGSYKVDSTDYETLNVLYPEKASKYVRMDAAAVKLFVNSNGEKTDFAFDGPAGIVYSDGEIIYDDNLVSDRNTTGAVPVTNPGNPNQGATSGFLGSIPLSFVTIPGAVLLSFIVVGIYVRKR